MNKLLIGCDPEIFVKSKKTGQYVSAHGLIPGTKDTPHRVEKGAVQVDGMALEFNTDPASTAEEFLDNVQTVMAQLEAMLPDDLVLALDPTATFTKAHFDLQPEEAKELGCEPDFNAYTMKENPRPDNTTTMRTASGHVHIGFCEGADPQSEEHMLRCSLLVKQLDAWLGVPSLLYDKDQKRRTMYGAPGAFRPKPYGVEYRVLSNRWLSSPDLIRWVFNTTKAAVDNLMYNKGVVRLGQLGSLYMTTYAKSVTSTAQLSEALRYHDETGVRQIVDLFPKNEVVK